ncbi:MAG TPA: hypothetical protein VIM47_01085 [Dermatophilaceae bacterium]
MRTLPANAAWGQVRHIPHLSYRQFDYWTNKNYIWASWAPGSGNPRTLPPGEVAVVEVMAALVHAGVVPAVAAVLARELAGGGVGTLGAFQVTRASSAQGGVGR